MIHAAPGFEERLAALRTWINESLASIYLAKLDNLDAGPSLTQLAEIALDLCAQVNLEGADGPCPLPFWLWDALA